VLAAIQGNIPQELKNDENLSDVMYRQFLETTRSLFDENPDPLPDMVIWPETVFPFPLGEGKPGDIWYESGYGFSESDRREKAFLINAIVKDLLAPRDIWFLTGVLSLGKTMDGKVHKRNGVYLYDPLGERRHAYYKTILVPGGEYLPLLDVIPFLRSAVESYANQVAGLLPDLSPGFGPAVMTCKARGVAYRFGVQICFENIYGDYCRRFIKEGAEFLINISNEGWFKESAEFDQMLAMSVFRAIETRRTLFRSTNTGISCMISPLGGIPGPEDRIMKDGRDRAVQGVLIRRVPLCKNSTVYTEVGDLFWKILFYGQIVLWGLLLLQKIWVTNTSLPE
jgi:apolipoprotein N-acyltransferase